MADGFEIGRALDRPLARPLPVGKGLSPKSRLGIVMGQQFGLCLGRLRKLGLQDLRNVLVVLLPCTLQQRLVGRVLDQGMLEDVHRLWR